MSKRNHAAAEAGEHEERIEVNLDAKDGEQVTRRPARGSVTRSKSDDGTEARMSDWEQRSRHVKKRLVQQARAFNQQIADQQAEFQRQLAIRDDRLAKLERGGDAGTADEAAHQKVMDDFEAKIAAAQEEGDSAKVAKLTREMTTADSKFWSAQTAKQTGGSGGGKNNEGGGAGNGAAPAAKVLQPTKAGVAWAKANAEWFDDPTDRNHLAAKAFANALYKDKADEGDDRDDPAFYEEIRKEVERRFPEIETVSTMRGARRADPDDDDDDDDDEVTTDERDDGALTPTARRVRDEPRRPSSISLPNRGDKDKHRGNRLATITGAEQKQMRAVNLDPTNNKHVMQWIESRNAMEQEA